MASEVTEDGGGDLGIEDEGEDAHFGATASASEGIDLEDASQEHGPAASEGPKGGPGGDGILVGARRFGAEAGFSEDAEFAPASAPADGVGAGVADEDLVAIGDVGEKQRQELERLEAARRTSARSTSAKAVYPRVLRSCRLIRRFVLVR